MHRREHGLVESIEEIRGSLPITVHDSCVPIGMFYTTVDVSYSWDRQGVG
jgi:hypothetical protein